MDMEQMFKSFVCFMQAQRGTTNTLLGESSTTTKQVDKSAPKHRVSFQRGAENKVSI